MEKNRYTQRRRRRRSDHRSPQQIESIEAEEPSPSRRIVILPNRSAGVVTRRSHSSLAPIDRVFKGKRATWRTNALLRARSRTIQRTSILLLCESSNYPRPIDPFSVRNPSKRKRHRVLEDEDACCCRTRPRNGCAPIQKMGERVTQYEGWQRGRV